METLIHTGLANALLAVLLAVLVAGLAILCRRRPALVHALWVLVLVKFLVPSVFPVAIPWWQPSAPQLEPPVPAVQESAVLARNLSSEVPQPKEDSSAEPMIVEPNGTAIDAERTVGPLDIGDGLVTGENTPSVELKVVAATSGPTISHDSIVFPVQWPWENLLGMFWLTGSLVWIGVAGIRIVRFQRILRLAGPAPVDVRIRIRDLSERLGLSASPSVGFVSAPIAPLLWALTRSPRLLIPRQLWERLNEEQRDTLLVHELAHLRRGDHWVRRLEMIVLAIYWWHPVVWWAQRQLREAEEQCCDAWVLWALPEAASNYAAALVETLAFLSHSRPALPIGASGIEPMRLLKRRLSMIVQGHPSRGISRLALWTVVVLGLVLLPLLPVPAQQTGNPEGDDEEQVQPPAPPGAPPTGPQTPPMKPPPVEGALTGADRAEQIEAAKDQVDLMEAKLMIKRAELEEMEMRIRLAQRNVDRLEELYKKGVLEEAALNKARNEAELLPTQLPTKKAELKEAEIMLKQAQRRLDRLESTQERPSGGPGGRAGMGPPAGMPGVMGPSGPTIRPKGSPMKGPGGLPSGRMAGPGASSGNTLPGGPPGGMPGKMGPGLPGPGGPMKAPPGLPTGPGPGQPPTSGSDLPAGSEAGASPMPPSDGAEGVVLEVDHKSGLVTVSIGSDSGLRKGSPLYVYRLKPNPKALGTIEILQVQANQAVGRLAIAHGAVEKGDLVAGMGDANGFVLDADPNTGLTTISIGTNSGIKPGSILEVYRLTAPNPKYMGKIEILEPQENSALGRKTLAPPTNPLGEGDLVVNKMIGKAGDTAAAPKPTSSWADSLFEEKSWEFGPVRRGEKLEHKFRLINRLDKPIHISSVRSSASFAKPIVVVELAEMGGAQSAKTEAWISPHQSIAIEVEMDTERFVGDKTANIYVQFDQPSLAHVQLQVHARSVESMAGTSIKGEPEESKARILELEQRVDQLLKQMDSLRKEIKQPPANPGPGNAPGARH